MIFGTLESRGGVDRIMAWIAFRHAPACSDHGHMNTHTHRPSSAGQPTQVNRWVVWQSTYLTRARFNCDTADNGQVVVGHMDVEFLSLAQVRYSNVPLSDWKELVAAPSKGVWLSRAIKSRQWESRYETLKGPSRPVTAELKARHGG